MGDLRKLMKWLLALVVVAFIQEKSANTFGGMFTEVFPRCRPEVSLRTSTSRIKYNGIILGIKPLKSIQQLIRVPVSLSDSVLHV